MKQYVTFRNIAALIAIGIAAVLHFAGAELHHTAALAGLGLAPLMMGDVTPLHSNVLELFKGAGINWKPGVDAELAIGMMKKAVSKALTKEELAKAFVQPSTATSGLAQYDLEQGARLLYPLTTIFRNMIARITGGTGIQSNWRAVTAINPAAVNIGLSEGHRGAFVSQTVVDKFAPFKFSGLDNYVTEQAYLAAVTFEDLLALAATITLQSTMEGEEQIDIGGNSSILLGTPVTPTQGATASTGGGLSNGTTYSVIVVPLTYLGMRNSVAPTVSGTTLSGGAVALPYDRVNADGSVDRVQGFSGIQSAASAAITLSGGTSTQVLNAQTTAIAGAIGYAWYLGATAGTERLVAITGYPTVTILNTNSTGQLAAALPATDTSTFALNYDGILTQILAAGSGAYVKDLGGAALTTTGSGTGGIQEFDNLIADRIANYRLVPTDIFMSPYDQAKAANLVLTGNTNLAPFVMSDASSNGLAAAAQLKVYNNRIGYGTPQLQVHAHPFLPAGTCIWYSRTNPYQLSNVPNLLRKLLRRDYWQTDWPVVTNQRTMGVYFDGVLQMYFPPAFGVITGMKN
jgi:hypothetical protein